MNNDYFYSYLHRQIPVMVVLSLFPGLGYIFLSWMHDIELRAIIWYLAIVAVSTKNWGQIAIVSNIREYCSLTPTIL